MGNNPVSLSQLLETRNPMSRRPHGEFVLIRYERQSAVHVYVQEHVHVNVHACDQIGKYMEANAGCPQWSVVVDVDVHVDVLVLVDVDGLDSFGPCN